MSEPDVGMTTQEDAEDCLHCAIMELVDARAAAGETDLGIITERLAESLVDLILPVPIEDQAQLLAHSLTALGDLYLQKRERRERWVSVDPLESVLNRVAVGREA